MSPARRRAILMLELSADDLLVRRYIPSEERPDYEAALLASVGGTRGDAADRLSLAAVNVTCNWCGLFDFATRNLEAAALLRDGWSPGEPVRGRNGGRRIW